MYCMAPKEQPTQPTSVHGTCHFRLTIGAELVTKFPTVMKPEGSLLQLVVFQGQLNPAILVHCFFNMLFNIILTSSARYPKLPRADLRLIFIRKYQGCTNSWSQVAVATKSYCDLQYLWALSVELASCRLSGACNFKVAFKVASVV